MQKLKAYFTIACLIATSVVTIATSQKQDGDQDLKKMKSEEVYLVASTCPQAVSYEKVTIQNQVITSPANFLPNQFGLPTSSISFKDDDILTGPINGRIRSCKHALVTTDDSILNVYTCSENGVEVCKVSFELDAVLSAL